VGIISPHFLHAAQLRTVNDYITRHPAVSSNVTHDSRIIRLPFPAIKQQKASPRPGEGRVEMAIARTNGLLRNSGKVLQPLYTPRKFIIRRSDV
jgi:hypothetical protein